MKQTIIAGYIRVSTKKQTVDAVSLEAQQDMITKHVMMLELVNKENEIMFYIDDGYSAKSLERPAIKKLIYDIKAGKIKMVFSYDLSRLSRDVSDANILIKLFDKYNTILKCLYDRSEIKTAGDRYTTNMQMAHYQYERERTVERTNDGLKFIVENGRYPCGGKVLLGYTRTVDKDITYHDINYPIVRKAFEMGLEKYPISEIKDYLNKHQNELKFTNSRVKDMFYNEKYAGIFYYKGKKYKNIIPPTITKKEQELLKKTYKYISTSKKIEYYFDGKVYCDICGSQLTCTHSKGRNQKYYYYKCSECGATISQIAIEKFLCSVSYIPSKDSRSIKTIDKKRYSLNRRIKNIREQYLDKTISDREFTSLVIPLEDKLDELNCIRNGLKMKKQNFTYNVNMIDSKKKEFVEANIRSIYVNPIAKTIIEIKYIY